MRYVATGRVHPERADINFTPVSFGAGGGGRVVAQCDSSQYSVEVIQVLEEDGTPHVFGVRPGTLEFEPSQPILNRALHLAAEDIFYRLALRDYVRAITDSTDCATYCYRAIESIKSSFVFKTGRNSWDDMHSKLGTDRASIEQEVKRFADPVRHGNWIAAPSTDGKTRLNILTFTRNVLVRYLDYAKPAV